MNQAEQFKQFVVEVFEIKEEEWDEDATPDDFENWTSVSHMDLMAKFEDAWGLELDVEEITEMDSIGAMMEILRKHGVDV